MMNSLPEQGSCSHECETRWNKTQSSHIEKHSLPGLVNGHCSEGPGSSRDVKLFGRNSSERVNAIDRDGKRKIRPLRTCLSNLYCFYCFPEQNYLRGFIQTRCRRTSRDCRGPLFDRRDEAHPSPKRQHNNVCSSS